MLNLCNVCLNSLFCLIISDLLNAGDYSEIVNGTDKTVKARVVRGIPSTQCTSRLSDMLVVWLHRKSDFKIKFSRLASTKRWISSLNQYAVKLMKQILFLTKTINPWITGMLNGVNLTGTTNPWSTVMMNDVDLIKTMNPWITIIMNFVGQVKQKLSVTKTKLTTMAYRPFRGMTLTRQYPRWQHRNLQRVLFSDESRFQLFRADGMTRIYRSARERIAPCCVQETVSIGGGSVMVWWGICGQQRTDLIVIDENLTAHRYINLLPFFQHQPRLLFQQDIAVIRLLTNSVRRLVHACILAHGGHTRY